MPDAVTSIGLSGLGVHLNVELANEVVPRLQRLLPPGLSVVDPALLEDEVPVAVLKETSDTAVRRLLADIEHEMASRSPDFTVIHAGVVGFPEGAVLLPGRSHAGKSTAVVELLRAGGRYYSDDLALVGRDGRVFPYPRAINRRVEGRVDPWDPQSDPSVEIGTEAIPVSIVVFTCFVPGLETFGPERLSPGAGVLRLLDHCFQAQTAPQKCLATLETLSKGASFWEGRRGDAQQFASAVKRLIEH
jgi:serine kinase of HPr protein (carbohydrate metabolism regulator)